ncbi:Conserved_hypothetical protein [Hexamita inflata]|uniref:Uncharacterized protein n=1 Tax=Hexamita inflata TaxID=28002 RepID=A0AA86QSG6_9EUKA|nr:Conserved hypothetical protein [Hexamita inflata]
MPIKFLQLFVKRNGNLFIRGPLSKRSEIAIDGDALLYYLYIQSQNFSYGGDTERLCQAARHFFSGLDRFEIRPVVFLPITPAETDSVKNQQKMQIFTELVSQLTADPCAQINRAARGFRFTPLYRNAFVSVLKDLKVSFMCTSGDVAPYVAHYAKENNVPVMGYDSVYLGYECQFCFIESLCFEDEPNKSKQELRDEVTCLKANSQNIAEFLQLTLPQLQTVMRLLPNEFVSEFNELRSTYDVAGNSKDPKDNMIFGLAEFVRTNWNNDENAMLKTLIEKQTQCFESQNAKKETHKNELIVKLAELAKQKTDLLQKEKNEFVEKALLDNEKAVTKVNEEKNSILMSQTFNKDLAIAQFKESKKLFEMKPKETAIQEFKNLPKWIGSFFKFGKLPIYVYQAAAEGVCSFQPFIEEVAAPAASQIGQELRAKIYGILGLQQVKEIQREGETMKEHVLKVEKSKIDLAASVKLTVEQRQAIVLELVLGDKLAKEVMKIEDQQTQLIASALLFLVKHVKNITAEQLAAIITGTLFPHKDAFVSKQLAANQIPRDMGMMTIISQYQNILEPIMAINNLFGQPIQANYESIINCPQILVQYQQEIEKDSAMRSFPSVFTKNDIPDDFVNYSKRQKTSQKLSRQEMQIAEQIASIAVANLVIVNSKIDYSNYLSTIEEDAATLEWEEKQAKKTKAGDFKLGKGNKFGAFEE